jgi:ferredoxin
MKDKTRIYYFSGTGNTLWLSKVLAAELGNADLAPMSGVDPVEHKLDDQAEKVVLAFPVYCGGIPNAVAKFMAALRDGDHKIYLLGNSGGFDGAAFYIARKILARRGLSVTAWTSVTMPGNYIPFYGAIKVEKQKKLFDRAIAEIKNFAGVIRSGKKRGPGFSFPLYNPAMAMLYKYFIKNLHSADKKFHADAKCKSCGLCVKVCPVSNVRLKNGKPEWLSLCEQCMACLQWCPEQAIQYGSISLNRKRYHHPEIKAKELMLNQ